MNKMNKVYLEKLNCSLFYDRPDDDDRVNFYDDNLELLDCIYGTDEELNEYLEKLKQIDDKVNLFAEFCGSFDFGNSVEDCLWGYIESLEYDDEVEEVYKDIKELNVKELLEKYDINVIGGMYFKGWW